MTQHCLDRCLTRPKQESIRRRQSRVYHAIQMPRCYHSHPALTEWPGAQRERPFSLQTVDAKEANPESSIRALMEQPSLSPSQLTPKRVLHTEFKGQRLFGKASKHRSASEGRTSRLRRTIITFPQHTVSEERPLWPVQQPKDYYGVVEKPALY